MLKYTLRDHLGNTRVTFADINTDSEIDPQREILQEAHYYPFGLQHYGPYQATHTDDNNYTYNGKETVRGLGLLWLDYGARWYDAAVARWWAVDPLAEKYAGWSAYNYVLGNPMIFIDPDGMAVEDVDGGVMYTGKDAANAYILLITKLTANKKKQKRFKEDDDEEEDEPPHVMFKFKTDKTLYEAGKGLRDESAKYPNLIVLALHGNINVLSSQGDKKPENWDIKNPQDFDNWMKILSPTWANSKDKAGLTILLISCNVGRDESAIVGELSKAYPNATFIAPTHYVYSKGGMYFTILPKQDAGTPCSAGVDCNQASATLGKWNQFRGGKIVHTYSGSWSPNMGYSVLNQYLIK